LRDQGLVPVTAIFELLSILQRCLHGVVDGEDQAHQVKGVGCSTVDENSLALVAAHTIQDSES
jgi:hypothetical protein